MMLSPFRLPGSREVMNFISIMILRLMCPVMPWAYVHRQLLQNDDMMQGHWTLLHVIGLVGWRKHVKSRVWRVSGCTV